MTRSTRGAVPGFGFSPISGGLGCRSLSTFDTICGQHLDFFGAKDIKTVVVVL